MAKIYKRQITDPVTGERKPGTIWWITYMDNGKQHKRSLKVPSKRMAEIAKADLEKNLERGLIGLPRRSVDSSKVFDQFREHVINRASSSWSLRLEQLIGPFIGFLKENNLTNLVRISTDDIELHLRSRLETIAPKTWNEELRIIKRFFKFAQERDYISRNPADVITMRHAEKPSVEILTPKEIALIMKYAAEVARPFYLILLYTGLREGEARHLRWQDVDLTAGKEHVKIRSTPKHRTKNRRDRVIPLCPEAVEVFEALWENRNRSSLYVLPNSQGNPKSYNHHSWTGVLQRIEENEGVRIDKGRNMTGLHLFRHTFATNALACGIDIRTVQDWLGHSSIVQTQRYLNLLPEHQHQQIKKLRFGIDHEQVREKNDERPELPRARRTSK